MITGSFINLLASSIFILSILSFILRAHLHSKSRAKQVYLGINFLKDLESEKHEIGFRLIEPILFLVRLLIILLCSILLSSLFWPIQEPKGTLLISQGPLEIPKAWPRPIQVVSAQAPHQKLLDDLLDKDRAYQVKIPRLLGPPKFLDALSSVLEKTVPSSYYYQTGETLNIDAYAEWKRYPNLKLDEKEYQSSDLNSEHLEIKANVTMLDASLELPKVLDLEVLVDPKSRSTDHSSTKITHRFIWRKFGELRQVGETGSYRWNSRQLKAGSQDFIAKGSDPNYFGKDLAKARITKSLLANRAIRIHSKTDNEAQINYPLCTPLAPSNFKIALSSKLFESAKIQDYFKRLGFQTPSTSLSRFDASAFRNWQIRSITQGQLSNVPTKKETELGNRKVHTRLWQLHGDQYSAFSPYYSNQSSDFFEQKRSKLFGIPKVWTPLSNHSQIQIYNNGKFIPNGGLALSLPQLPMLPSIFTSYHALNRGEALLWLTDKSVPNTKVAPSSANDNGVELWQSTDAIVSHELDKHGSRRYHFGVDIHLLIEQSPLWLTAILKTLMNEESIATASCYEWKEGDILWAHLPIQSQKELIVKRLKANGVLSPVNLKFSDQNRIELMAHQEGIYHLTFPSSDLGENKKFKRNLFIARQKKPRKQSLAELDQYGQLIKKSETPKDKQVQKLALGNLQLPLLKRIKLHWHSLSGLQHKVIYICMILLGLACLIYFFLRRIALLKTLIIVTALTALMASFLCLGESNYLSSKKSFESFNLIPITQIVPQGTQVKSKINQNLLNSINNDFDLGFKFKGEQSDSLQVFEEDWGKFIKSLKSIFYSVTDNKSLFDDRSTLLTSISSIYQSKDHYQRFNNFSGIKWLKPSLHGSQKSMSPPLFLSHYSMRRDQAQQEILLRTLFKSKREFQGKLGEVYVDGAKVKFQLNPQGNLLSFRIKDRNQTSLKLKLEFHNEVSLDPKSSSTYEQEITLVIPRVKRKAFWAWGTYWLEQLTGLGLVLAQALNTQQLDALPSDLFGIALHKVDPQFLSGEAVEQLYEWVSQGGLLIWSGTLNEAQKKRYRNLEQNHSFKALMPLSAKDSIPQDREAQVVFIIDRSGSTDRLAGGPGLAQITDKLSSLVAQLAPKDEVTLVSFGGGTELTLAPTSRSNLSHLPVPNLSRGGTVLHPALELALSYRRPSLEAHWVIVSDGEWGDESDRLLGDLVQRIKASGVQLSIAHFEHAGDSKCQGLCRRFANAVKAQTLDWLDLDLEQLQEPLIAEYRAETVKLKSSKIWDQKIGGDLGSVSSFTPMSLRQSAETLAFAQGYPIFAEKRLGLGRVIQLMSDELSLTKSQWKRVLNLNQTSQVPWSIELVNKADIQYGHVSEIVAYSEQGLPSGPGLLSSVQKQEQGYWLPRNNRVSVFTSCEQTFKHKDRKLCKAVGLSEDESEYYTVQFTSDSQLHTVDLVTPSLGSLSRRAAGKLNEHELAMEWSRELERIDYQKFDQAQSNYKSTQDGSSEQNLSQSEDLASSYKLIPSLKELKVALGQGQLSFSNIHLSFYIVLISLILIFIAVMDTYFWQREK